MPTEIIFKKTTTDVFLLPISPASSLLPDWYREAETHNIKDDPWAPGTFKACMPFLDALTCGYVVPLWTDIYVVSAFNEELQVMAPTFSWSPNNPRIEVGCHGPGQVQGIPQMESSTCTAAFKFECPWVIETPPGYSCLITNPLNQHNDKFQVFSAVVATDNYPRNIGLPFSWTAPLEWEGVIKQGTSLVQIIPFKRTDFKHRVETFSTDEQNLLIATGMALRSTVTGGYKRLFRKRAKYS